ncbi:agmatine deiminase [Raphidocelis subcapitata]|uniref:Agmatine deiminase n=1 Tax=Raphidocelis subcapitata TaxID=307507 RepID=A0A2V0P638_9CHLO|nr:agmatine deiminase [Raphidocelis subcapitata]GBF92545.1 agmatine deiminase [Raphidocelis subcapitata]|eukprot:GBF92539.1 agmatine deiminase [Raphidocelis subcapitata]
MAATMMRARTMPTTNCRLAAPRLAAPKAARSAPRRPTLAARAASAPAASAPVDTAKTPKAQGFTMPGEFEKHAGCWMGWPYDKYLWRGDALPAKKQYAAVAKTISQFEPVTMWADPSVVEEAKQYLADAPNVTVTAMPINDGWLRDWGPTCVARTNPETGKREVAGVHWDYDCYGAPGKIRDGRPAMMPNWDKDYAAGRAILEHYGLPVFECPLHLEGGSIHSDGQGTLMVTEECLLDPSRNPHLGKEGIEKLVKDFLGIDKVIWLWKGMAGDTEVVNGHVDNMACFIRPGVVAISWTEDKFDPQYECSSRNVEILESTTDARGRKIEVIKVPCPPPMFRTHHEADTIDPEHITKGYVPRLANARLPGSYINHYCANGGAVVPQFGYPTDQQAIDVLQKAYGPGYKVVGVPGGTREVLLNAGNVHCITQQHVLAGDV